MHKQLLAPKQHFYPSPPQIDFQILKTQQQKQILHHKALLAWKDICFDAYRVLDQGPEILQPFLLPAPGLSHEGSAAESIISVWMDKTVHASMFCLRVAAFL